MRITHLVPGLGALALAAALLSPTAVQAAPTAPACEVDRPIRFSGLNWESNLVLAGIERFVLEHGYGCKTSVEIGETLPKGDYQVGLFANQLTSLIPGECNLFCSENIPTPANGNSGNNWYRVSIKELDPLLRSVDTNLDDATRKSDAAKADDIMATNQVTLPLDPLPDIVIWNKNVVGPVGDNAIMGPFWNLAEWGVKK